MKLTLLNDKQTFFINQNETKLSFKNPSNSDEPSKQNCKATIEISYNDKSGCYSLHSEDSNVKVKILKDFIIDHKKVYNFKFGKENCRVYAEKANDEHVLCIKTFNEKFSFNKKDMPIKIGRNNSNNVSLNHPSISKVHAFVELKDSELILKDNRSTNGIELVLDINETYELSTCEVISLVEGQEILIEEFFE